MAQSGAFGAGVEALVYVVYRFVLHSCYVFVYECGYLPFVVLTCVVFLVAM